MSAKHNNKGNKRCQVPEMQAATTSRHVLCRASTMAWSVASRRAATEIAALHSSVPAVTNVMEGSSSCV